MVFCNMGRKTHNKNDVEEGHNPYFNRWFSAIKQGSVTPISGYVSQSLF